MQRAFIFSFGGKPIKIFKEVIITVNLFIVFFNLAFLRSKYPALITDSLFAIASIFAFPKLAKVGLSPAIPTIAEIKISTFKLETSHIAL